MENFNVYYRLGIVFLKLYLFILIILSARGSLEERTNRGETVDEVNKENAESNGDFGKISRGKATVSDESW